MIVYFIESKTLETKDGIYWVYSKVGQRSFVESVILPKESLEVDLIIKRIFSSEKGVSSPTELKSSIFILSNDPINPLLKIDYKANIKDPNVFS